MAADQTCSTNPSEAAVREALAIARTALEFYASVPFNQRATRALSQIENILQVAKPRTVAQTVQFEATSE